MALISIWSTPDFLFSFGKIVGLLYGIALCYAVVEWGQRRESILPVALVVVGLGCAAAILSLLGTGWVVKLPLLNLIVPYLPEVIRGVPGAESGFNPNQVTGALIMFLPLQICLLLGVVTDDSLPTAGRYWLALGLGLALALTTIVVLLAQSRAAWAAVALGLLGLGAIAVRRLRPILAVLLLAGIVALMGLGPVGVGEWLAQQGWMVSSGEASWTVRLELWTRGLWTIAESPLTGTGMNIFRQIVWRSYPPVSLPYGLDVGHAHQTYIQVALDLGLPGLVSYLAVLGGTLASGWRVYGGSSRRLARLVAIGGLTGVVVQAIWGLTDAVALGAKQSFLWWIVVALVITTAIQASAETPSVTGLETRL
jgi:putative inorganic carbon (HCO3(-)) transporter